MYCGECVEGTIPEPMVIIERSIELKSKTYRCKGCNKVVTLVVAQEVFSDAS